MKVLTWDDGYKFHQRSFSVIGSTLGLTQSAAKIGKANLRQIYSVDQNIPFSSLHKPEERQRKGALPGAGPSKNTDLWRHSP